MAASTITRFFTRASTIKPSESDDIVLAPESINSRRDPGILTQPDEFKLQGEQYVRCAVLARGPKSTKKRTSVIWLYGQDLQSKKDEKRVWYCYLCEKQRRQQDLPAISSGNSTALDHLHLKHDIDKTTEERKSIRGESVESSQPSISDYQDMRSIIFSRRLDSAVTRGMSEWIVLFVTVLSVAGGIALLIYCYLCGPQDLSWVPHTTL
jgi:hypothetical protein